jgi:SAM-dependent methyltransferase
VDTAIENSASLPFAASSFDTVCCIATLNHIPEREAFLREAKRILRPHGRLVLTMLPPGISRTWHLLRSPWDADQHERGMKNGEVYGLSTNTMKALLETAGFYITHVSSFMLGINKLYVAENS